ncbi:MAG: CARDB domain-containing protein, partial [candidate division Zixibacteria bacterium]|nr:CARDB domain-containing protein [candidate division Zixibacteria bacterium]
DLAVTNSGNATSDPFSVSLYLDGGLLVGELQYYSYLFAGADHYFEDHMAYISAGYHSLTMIIDPLGLIEETCETDNVYEKVFYWPAPGTITVSGWATYQDMNPPSSGKNARNMKVEMWDDDAAADDLLALTWTTAGGAFVFGTVSNADESWLGRQDIYLKFYAENDAAYVDKKHDSSRVTYQTGTQSEVPNGTLSLGTVNIPGPQSGPFFILDKIKDGRDKWLSFQQSDPGRVEAILRNGGGTEYVSGYIVIDSSINDNFYRPDVFDEYAILHEYGHFLADSFSFFCVGSGTHSWHTRSTDTLAASEAFAHLWPAVVTDNSIEKNYYHGFAYYYSKNLENGEYGINGNIAGSPNDLGPDCEGTVAGVLWDLYDDDDDDYTMWKPGSPGVGQPDGIWDSLDNAMTNILECLTRRNTGAGHHPLNIYEFWNVWFQSPTLDNNQKLWGVYREHGTGLEMDIVPPTGSVVINSGDSITTSLIVALALSATDTLSGMAPPLAKMQFSNNNSVWTDWETYATSKTGWNLSAYGGDTMRTTKAVYVRYKDVADIQSPSFFDYIIYRDYLCGDANADGKINVGDARYIVVYVFEGGAAPRPLEAGDPNCDGKINTGDAIYIVNYIFRQGPAPCCPS